MFWKFPICAHAVLFFAFDKLAAAGVSLDDTVSLILSLGYIPEPNTNFLVMDNTGVGAIGGTTGLFTWSGPEGVLIEGEQFAVDGLVFSITYRGGTGNDVVLTALPEPCTAVSLVGDSHVSSVFGGGAGGRKVSEVTKAFSRLRLSRN